MSALQLSGILNEACGFDSLQLLGHFVQQGLVGAAADVGQGHFILEKRVAPPVTAKTLHWSRWVPPLRDTISTFILWFAS
jgi:hypothetical protein